MNSSLTENTLHKIIQFTTNLKMNYSPALLKNLQKQIKNKECSNKDVLNENSLSRIFSDISNTNNKIKIPLNYKSSTSLRLTFRTFHIQTFQQLFSENWYFETNQIASLYSNELTFYQLKTHLLAIISIVQKITNKTISLFQNIQQCAFVDYQIYYGCLKKQENIFSNKYKLQLKIKDQMISTTILYNIPEKIIIKNPKSNGRKLSQETNYSDQISKTQLNNGSKLYSFYDEENDVTFITSQKNAIQDSFEENNIIFEDEEEQQFEYLQSDESYKLRQFKEILNTFTSQKVLKYQL